MAALMAQARLAASGGMGAPAFGEIFLKALETARDICRCHFGRTAAAQGGRER